MAVPRSCRSSAEKAPVRDGRRRQGAGSQDRASGLQGACERCWRRSGASRIAERGRESPSAEGAAGGDEGRTPNRAACRRRSPRLPRKRKRTGRRRKKLLPPQEAGRRSWWPRKRRQRDAGGDQGGRTAPGRAVPSGVPSKRKRTRSPAGAKPRPAIKRRPSNHRTAPTRGKVAWRRACRRTMCPKRSRSLAGPCRGGDKERRKRSSNSP